MALSNKDYTNLGMLGALVALFAGVTLKLISQLVSLIPGLTLDLQAISITTTGLTGVVGTGLGTFAQKILGVLPITGMDWIITAIGGALFVMLGGFIYDNVKQLQFGKTKVQRLAVMLVYAGIVSGWILSMAVTIPAIPAIVVMVVDALTFVWIASMIPPVAKLFP